MTTDSILLYTAKVCPFAARTELALELSGVKYETYEIDLSNKPSWYADKINKASKVPCLVLNAEEENEFKLPESQVIVEYLADALPNNQIFPASAPRQKAWARYLVERYMQLVTAHYFSVVFKQDFDAQPKLVDGLKQFGDLLGEGPFVQGAKFGYTDLHIAPFMGRILSVSKHDMFPTDPNATIPVKPIHKEVEENPDLARIKQWWSAVEAHPAWKAVWDEEAYLEPLRKHLTKS